MVGEVTVQRLVSELQARPLSTAKELQRRVGLSEKGKINQLLYKHKTIFCRHEPLPGKYAPRWSLKEGAQPTEQELEDGREVCPHCRQVPSEGLEEICRIGACVNFIAD